MEQSSTEAGKAYCNICEKEFRSHLGDLKTHSKTQKHTQLLELHETHILDFKEDDFPINTYIASSGVNIFLETDEKLFEKFQK